MKRGEDIFRLQEIIRRFEELGVPEEVLAELRHWVMKKALSGGANDCQGTTTEVAKN